MKPDEDREEVFDGRLEECIVHLANRLNEVAPHGTRRAANLRLPMAEFCGVELYTINDWVIRRRYRPKGLNLIKLMCYLDMIGYRVRELEKMNPAVRGFNELLGYGVISPELGRELLGYADVSHLFRVLAGKHKATPEHKKKILDEWVERSGELGEKKSAAAKHYMLRLTSEAEQADGNPPSTQKATIHLMEALLDLFESGVFSPLTLADLDNLKRAGKDVMVHRLFERLNALDGRLSPSESE